MAWDLSPLDRYVKRVQKDIEDSSLYALEGTSKNFSAEIQNYYPNAVTTIADAEVSSDGVRMIANVHDEDLWFHEFGTGFDGMDSGYINELPKTSLSFFSRGASQTTAGWQWAYHPLTREAGGWWYVNPDTGKFEFTTGQPAQMGFAKSVNYFKARGVPHLAEYIKMKMGGG